MQRDSAGRDVARVARAAALGADDRAAEPLARLGEHVRGGVARVEARPRAHHRRLEPHLVELGRQRGEDGVERLQPVGAQVAQQLALGGHDVEGVARAQDRRHRGEPVGSGGVVVARPRAGPWRPAPAARCGPAPAPSPSATSARARSRAAWPPPSASRSRPRRPAPVRSPPSKHRHASKPAKRSAWMNGAVRHSSSFTSRIADLGVQLRALGQLAHERQRQRHAALHVHGARAGEAVAVARRAGGAPRGATTVSRWPEQQQPARAACRGGGRPGRRRGPGWSTSHPLDLRLGGQERRGERHALLGALHVAGRRRHRHQRLELALDHSSGAAKW